MTQYLDRYTALVPSMNVAMRLEPRVSLDLSLADIPTIISVMICLLTCKARDRAAVKRYLRERGCPFADDVVDFLLDEYDGDDPITSLWREDSLGRFRAYGFDDLDAA